MPFFLDYLLRIGYCTDKTDTRQFHESNVSAARRYQTSIPGYLHGLHRLPICLGILLQLHNPVTHPPQSEAVCHSRPAGLRNPGFRCKYNRQAYPGTRCPESCLCISGTWCAWNPVYVHPALIFPKVHESAVSHPYQSPFIGCQSLSWGGLPPLHFSA